MPTNRILLRIGVALGALMTCGPLWGILGAFLGMSRAVRTMGKDGIGDPHQLSQAVSATLLSTAGGLALFPFGVVLLVVCILRLRRWRQSGPPPLPRFPEKVENPPDLY